MAFETEDNLCKFSYFFFFNQRLVTTGANDDPDSNDLVITKTNRYTCLRKFKIPKWPYRIIVSPTINILTSLIYYRLNYIKLLIAMRSQFL